MIHLNVFDGRNLLRLQVPETWNELTGEQLIELAGILMEFDQFPMERDVLLVHVLCGIDKHIMRKVSAAVVCEQLIPLVQWVHRECNLTKQLIPFWQYKSVRFFGPMEALGNMTVGEFDFAERALFRWHQDMANTDLLYEFVACIYRPAKKDYDFEKNPDGDCREPFNPNTIPHYAQFLQCKLPLPVACAFAIWYKGCRSYILERFKPVFSGGTEENAEPQEPQYFDLMRAIAKEGIYGNFEQVSNMPLYTALFEMVTAIEENQRQLQQIENMKNGGGDEA